VIRIRKYNLDEVLPFVVMGSKKEAKAAEGAEREYLGKPVKMYSLRYQLFKTKGVKCVGCGIEGVFFGLEQHCRGPHRPHFNLYAIDDDGNEVLMTKDHIIPKSKGGKDFLGNLQPMCSRCNARKGDRYHGETSEVQKVQNPV